MNSRHQPIFVTLFAFVSLTLASGCGDSTKRVHDSKDGARPDPLVWFDTLSQRATKNDIAYVRANTLAEVFAKPHPQTTGSHSNDASASLCEELMFSKPSNWTATDDPKRIALTATRIAPGMFGGSAWQYTLDLVHDGGGWKIASWPYGQTSVAAPARAAAK